MFEAVESVGVRVEVWDGLLLHGSQLSAFKISRGQREPVRERHRNINITAIREKAESSTCRCEVVEDPDPPRIMHGPF
jgi:hypothetical protein